MKKLLIILALIPVLSFGQVEFITDTKGLIKVRPPAGNCDTTAFTDSMPIYYGNDLKLGIGFWEPPDSVNLYFADWDTTYRVKNDWKTQSIAMSLIFIYADECYRDSTKYYSKYEIEQMEKGLTIYGHDWTAEDIRKDKIERTKYYNERYYHKQPTFPGFIEWLKKK